MDGNVPFPGGDCLGELTNAGLHGSTLARQGILALTLGCDTESGLGKITRGLRLGIAQEGDA